MNRERLGHQVDEIARVDITHDESNDALPQIGIRNPNHSDLDDTRLRGDDRLDLAGPNLEPAGLDHIKRGSPKDAMEACLLYTSPSPRDS